MNNRSFYLYQCFKSGSKRFKTVMSGIQPTGIPHLGNYISAIQQWTELQHNPQIEKIYISIVDLHALTPSQKNYKVNENVYQMLASLVACGLHSEKIVLFQQSKVFYHTLLSWILMCVCPLNRVLAMPQWKEKVNNSSESESLNTGLLMYPILQAADILLYAPDFVPVGEDQIIHLELTRYLRSRLIKWQTDKSGNELSKYLPDPQIMQCRFPKVYSLKVCDKKMSKSDPNSDSRIELTDSPDQIKNKIRKALTDCYSKEITYDVNNRPALANLINIYCYIKKITLEEALNSLKDFSKLQFKELLIEELIKIIDPVRLKIADLLNNRDEMDRILKHGHEAATEKASVTMEHILRHIDLNTQLNNIHCSNHVISEM